MMAAREMAEMAEHVPEGTGDAADYALRGQLGARGIGKQHDRRPECHDGNMNMWTHAHGRIPVAFATIRTMVPT